MRTMGWQEHGLKLGQGSDAVARHGMMASIEPRERRHISSRIVCSYSVAAFAASIFKDCCCREMNRAGMLGMNSTGQELSSSGGRRCTAEEIASNRVQWRSRRRDNKLVQKESTALGGYERRRL